MSKSKNRRNRMSAIPENRAERRRKPDMGTVARVAEEFASRYTGLLHSALLKPQLGAMQEEMEEQRKLIDQLRLEVFVLNGGTEDGFRELNAVGNAETEEVGTATDSADAEVEA